MLPILFVLVKKQRRDTPFMPRQSAGSEAKSLASDALEAAIPSSGGGSQIWPAESGPGSRDTAKYDLLSCSRNNAQWVEVVESQRGWNETS